MQPYWGGDWARKRLTSFTGGRHWVRLYLWLIDSQREPVPPRSTPSRKPARTSHPPPRLRALSPPHEYPPKPHPPGSARHREDLHGAPHRVAPHRTQGLGTHRDGTVPPVLCLRGLRPGIPTHRERRIQTEGRSLPPLLRARAAGSRNSARLHHRRDQPGQPVAHLRRTPHADRSRQAQRGVCRFADLRPSVGRTVPHSRQRLHSGHDEHRRPVAGAGGLRTPPAGLPSRLSIRLTAPNTGRRRSGITSKVRASLASS